jgi:DNA polymerase-3 subunit beta
VKITVAQNVLAAALAHGAAVAPRNAQIPILAHVRLIASDGKLAVASSDLIRFAEAVIDVSIERPGSVTVPGAAFLTLVSKYPKDGAISLEVEAGQMVVRCGRSKVKLPTLPADNFPAWADQAPTHEFDLDGSAFRLAASRVRAAASKEEVRHYLCGVYIHAVDDVLRMAATDGHRLAVCSIPLPEGAEELAGAIIPNAALDTVFAIFKGSAGIHVAMTEKSVSFSAAGLRLSSKLVDGSFPDYTRVIPARGMPGATFKRSAFVDCLDRANVLTGDGAFMGIRAEPAGDFLRLRAANPSGGSAEEELPAVVDEGFQAFGFNPRYAAEFLQSLPVEELTIEQTAPDQAHLVVSQEAPDFVGVLMPMRVSLAA